MGPDDMVVDLEGSVVVVGVIIDGEYTDGRSLALLPGGWCPRIAG